MLPIGGFDGLSLLRGIRYLKKVESSFDANKRPTEGLRARGVCTCKYFGSIALVASRAAAAVATAAEATANPFAGSLPLITIVLPANR